MHFFRVRREMRLMVIHLCDDALVGEGRLSRGNSWRIEGRPVSGSGARTPTIS